MKIKIKEFISFCNIYGLKCFIIVKISNILNCKKRKSLLSWYCLKKKHETILSYLYKKYKGYLNIKIEPAIMSLNYQQCIWTAWLQGEDNAPEVIRLTIQSMKLNSNGHRVIILTNDNIKQFIDIPDKIQAKYNNGKISNAHFADIIRMMVLSKYGGLWLDATTYVSSPISDSIFSTSFFSVNRNDSYNPYVSKGKWVVGIIGGSVNSQYLHIISTLLNKYWIEHDLCIDYFVFDYIIALLYRENNQFKDIVDNLVRGNEDIYNLRKIINDKYDEDMLQKMFTSSQFFILPHRKTYLDYDDLKAPTYYLFLKEAVTKDKDI